MCLWYKIRFSALITGGCVSSLPEKLLVWVVIGCLIEREKKNLQSTSDHQHSEFEESSRIWEHFWLNKVCNVLWKVKESARCYRCQVKAIQWNTNTNHYVHFLTLGFTQWFYKQIAWDFVSVLLRDKCYDTMLKSLGLNYRIYIWLQRF